jgi:hypothetical protein
MIHSFLIRIVSRSVTAHNMKSNSSSCHIRSQKKCNKLEPLFFSIFLHWTMKFKRESPASQQAKFARLSSATLTFPSGRKREDEYNQKCAFAHYVFLMVECMCAHGLPLDLIEESCVNLSDAASGPTLKHWKCRLVAQHPSVCTCKLFQEATEGERVRIEGRDLSSWVPHALMMEFH